MELFRLCRICMSESAVMMSIFGEDALWKKIKSLANVNIVQDDGLPQQICMICVKNAINAYSFKEKCEESDSFFRAHIANIEFDIISISSEEELDTKINNLDEVNGTCFENFEHNNYSSTSDDQTILTNGDATNLYKNTEVSIEISNLPDVPNSIQSEVLKPTKGYQCSICYDVFAMKSILKHHVKQSHPDSTKTFECFDCKKNYNSQRFLEKHVRLGNCQKKDETVYISKKVTCPQCRAIFPTGRHFGWHKRTSSCAIQTLPGSSQNALSRQNSFTSSRDDDNTNDKSSYIGDSDVSESTNEKQNNEFKKPRKPNVFIDNDKYEKAKIMVANNATTMDIARALNVSQMSAWKLRDCIIKGISLSFRSHAMQRPKPDKTQPKQKIKRPRLTPSEKFEREKQLQIHITEILKEDNTMQYWKISEKLIDKGYSLSPSSVCQRLKTMGIHRRLKAQTNKEIIVTPSMNELNHSNSDIISEFSDSNLPSNNTI